MTTDTAGGPAAPAAPAQTRFQCPACGWSGSFDYRFTAWCENCGHGADTGAPEKLKPRAARKRERDRAAALARHRALTEARELRPTSAAGIAVTVLATLVHLVTALLAVGSILLVATYPNQVVAWIGALIGLGAAAAVRPRFAYRRRKDVATWVTRDQAPQLFALLDRCAAALGAPVPARICFSPDFNAGTMRIGLLRPETGLLIGVPLWSILTGQERTALLGHELGHQINDDVIHGLWAHSAQRSLVEWVKLVNPRFRRSRRLSRSSGIAAIADLLSPYIMFAFFIIPFLLVLGSLRGLRRLDLTSGQRAEYLADEFGSRVGSSAATAALLDKLALRESVTHYLTVKANQRSTEVPWPGLRAYTDTIPGHELRRRVLVEVARRTRIDSTHPANYLRRDLIRARPQLPGTVFPTDAEWAGIDAEIRPFAEAVARKALKLRGAQQLAPATIGAEATA